MSRQTGTPQKRPKSRKDRVLDLAWQAGVLRPRDLDAEGIPRVYLRRLLAEGLSQFTATGDACDLQTADGPGLPTAVLPQRVGELDHDLECPLQVESSVVGFAKDRA